MAEHISVNLGVDEYLSVSLGVEEHISVSLEVGNTSQYSCHGLVLKG